MLKRLVDREARAEGRDLEQDAARLAEVDRLEVEAVDDRRRPRAGLLDGCTPRLVFLLRRCPRDVVHCSGALLAALLRDVVLVEAAPSLAAGDEAGLEPECPFEEPPTLFWVERMRAHTGETAQRVLFRNLGMTSDQRLVAA